MKRFSNLNINLEMNQLVELSCVKLPEQDLAYLNNVYISTLTLNFIGLHEHKFVYVNGTVFRVGCDSRVQANEIALSGLQRESFGFELGQKLMVRPCNDEFPVACTVTLDVDYRSKTRTFLKERDITQELYDRYKGRVLSMGQQFPLLLSNEAVIVCRVCKMEELSDAGEPTVTEPIETGALDDGTLFRFNVVPNPLMMWERTAGFCPSIRGIPFPEGYEDGEYKLVIKNGRVVELEKIENEN